MIDKKPEIMLVMVEGTKNGDTRLGPLFVSFKWFCSICSKPPIPEPIATPTRCALSCEIVKPESTKACLPAAIPSWIKRSIFLVSFFSMYSCGSKSLI